jgi:hypothetical protein
LAATNQLRRTSGGLATFGYDESTVPRKNSAGLLRMITDLVVSIASPEMASKAISYNQVL